MHGVLYCYFLSRKILLMFSSHIHPSFCCFGGAFLAYQLECFLEWLLLVSCVLEAPIWGGVYIGPASNISIYSLSTCASPTTPQDAVDRGLHSSRRKTAGEKSLAGVRKFFGRSRSHSRSKSPSTELSTILSLGRSGVFHFNFRLPF